MKVENRALDAIVRPQPAAAAKAEAKATVVAQASAPDARALALLQGPTPKATDGILDLASPEAQKAIARSLEHLNAQGYRPEQFQALSVVADTIGMVHVRFARMLGNLPVVGEQAIVHLSGGVEGSVSSMTADVGPTPISTQWQVRVTPRQAREAAVKAFADDYGVLPQKTPSVTMVVYPMADGQYVQAYCVELVNLGGPKPARASYLVNAETGDIVASWNAISPIWQERPIDTTPRGPVAPSSSGTAPTPRGAADDKTLYSGYVEIFAKKLADDKYVLLDESRGKGIETRDAKNNDRAWITVEIPDNNNIWSEAGDNVRQKSAVDAHFGAQMTYDALRDMLGFNSIDLKGYKLKVNVHIGSSYVNAFWDGSSMNIGDGDGSRATALSTIDIIAHEIIHGLTSNTARLIYSGESGGLNEAASDIGGVMVEYYAAKMNPGLGWDWTMGEDCWTPNNGDPNDGLRYMDDPTKDKYSIDHYSKYPTQTEVHGSSGIGNNFFYQLAENRPEVVKKANSVSGLKVEGIGMEKASAIFFRALAHYMTSSTNFAAARKATIQAAKDLVAASTNGQTPHGQVFTDLDVQRVGEAWTAVGVM